MAGTRKRQPTAEQSARATVNWASAGSDFGCNRIRPCHATSFSVRVLARLNFHAALCRQPISRASRLSPSLSQHARAAFRSITRIFIDCDLYEGKDALYYTEPVIKRNCRARSTTTTTREREREYFESQPSRLAFGIKRREEKGGEARNEIKRTEIGAAIDGWMEPMEEENRGDLHAKTKRFARFYRGEPDR